MTNFYKLFVVVLLSLQIGCWDRSNSPLIKNASETSIKLQLEFQDREESFLIDGGKSLLLPDILSEKDFQTMKLVKEDGQSKSLTKQEIIALIGKGNRVFVIQSDLSIAVETR